jgi:hypothetical protein
VTIRAELTAKIGKVCTRCLNSSMHDTGIPAGSNDEMPNLSKLRSGLFWDTDIKRINWLTQRLAVIERVTQRGNDEEIAEIKRFYGEKAFNQTVDFLKSKQQ